MVLCSLVASCVSGELFVPFIVLVPHRFFSGARRHNSLQE